MTISFPFTKGVYVAVLKADLFGGFFFFFSF